MASVGSIVYGSDYNAVQIKVRQVLGDGYPYGPMTNAIGSTNAKYGWGQTMLSSLVNPSDLVDDQQWLNLVTDVDKAYRHQSNTGLTVSLHSDISYTDLSTLDTYANTLLASKNSVNAAQKTQDPIPANGQVNVGATWGSGDSYVTSYAHVYFNSDAEMQYFFNQGSTIDIQGIGPGTANDQDTSWNTLLAGVTINVDLTSFSSMSTTAMTQIASYTSANAIYSSNTVQVSAMRFQNFLVFRMRFTDGHVALGLSPADNVAGGAGYSIRWTRSSGAFTGIQPDVYAGQFTSSGSTIQGGFTGGSPGPIPQYNSSGLVFTHSITKNIQNYNLYYMVVAHGGNPANVNATITVGGNVYLWSNNNGIAGLDFVSVGGSIGLVNNGYIMGKGGNGGAVLPDESGNTNTGQAGGAAIRLGAINATITNSNGYILGGGGGGGAAGYGTVNSSDYHYGGGGGGGGGGRGGAGYSSAAYLANAIAISPAGTSTNATFALVLPGASGQNGSSGAAAPSGGGGGRIALALANLAGPSGTTLTPGYGGSSGGSGGIWGGPLSNLSATGGTGGVVVAGQNTPTTGGNGSSTAGTPGSIAGGGGGSWGGAGGAGSYNGVGGSAGGAGGNAVLFTGAGRPSWFTPGFIATRTFGAVS